MNIFFKNEDKDIFTQKMLNEFVVGRLILQNILKETPQAERKCC
jgi:hypothetical protein